MIAVNGRQSDRVVNQHHRTGGQHRHAGQTRQARELWPQIFNHDFPVAQHLIDVHGQALTSTAEHGHLRGLVLQLLAARRDLQQRASPVKRDRLSRHVDNIGRVGLLQRSCGHPQNGFHQVRGHPDGEISHAQHHHLGNRCGEWQHQLKGRSLTHLGGGLYAPTQRVDFGAHHIHADTPTRKFRDLVRRRESRHEQKTGRLLGRQLRVFVHQALCNGFGTDFVQMQTTAIITE